MKPYKYNSLFEKSCPGKVNYTVGIVIKSDLKTVWENVCKADLVKKYFTTDARRDLDKGGEVLWVWGDEAALLNFENINGKVKIKIKETGWDGDESGAKSAFANCSGWTEFLNALKVYTEYNIAYLNK